MGRPKKNKDNEAGGTGLKEPKRDSRDVRADMISSVITGANERYKQTVLCSARDEAALVVPRISTGLYGLDVATNGGFPLKRVTLVYGEKSGGKTTLLLRGLSRFQQLCGNCYQVGVFEIGNLRMANCKTGKIEEVRTQVMVDCPCKKPRDMTIFWIDAEGVWEIGWPEKMGVWTEKIMLSRPAYGEQGYDIARGFADKKIVDMIIIDSLAAMTPSKETEVSMLDNQQGIAARMNNRWIRLIVSAMNSAHQAGRPITVWMTNQYREKIGVLFGDPRVLPGGRGASFSSSLEIEMTPKKVTLDEKTREPLFGDFEYYVKRNKVGPAGGKGEFQQCMADTDLFKIGDLMEHDPVIKRAVGMGFIDHPNQQTYEYNKTQHRGISALIRYFGENPNEFEELKEKMLRIRLGIVRAIN